MTKIIEVLAPAGNLLHVEAAIQGGANAFYVGLKGLSARPNMWSFDIDELKVATQLAHDSGCKIYVALNAEFQNKFTSLLAGYFEEMIAMSVDAIIVGDFGLLHFIKENNFLGKISIHASTLLGIYNAEGIRFLAEEYNVTRTVLNTNLYVDEIADINFHCPDMELEMISYGGVCFNDNRRCRQPHYLFEKEFCVGCKQLYTKNTNSQLTGCHDSISKVASQIREPEIPVEGERLIWSPEIDLTSIVGLFIRVGVTSFKIEGRTRTAEYVKESTSKMREAIDQTLQDTNLSDPELNPFFYLGHHAQLVLND